MPKKIFKAVIYLMIVALVLSTIGGLIAALAGMG
ncbi:stressosome-associated protein Prli42 [Sporolactobacillus spathodeae]|uniref:DUF4044 domain-containing protein n=1 Tax=Sporolactobacillus spathodeae TaxID=1465502 RepID=A0ABS2QA78_9BACL|nr:stressosome-associated protein Prli42 [Sporolactobacillus spathodeae]MBM7657882.1 hypothetical protein [Sporolactobacillus spathodeae]